MLSQEATNACLEAAAAELKEMSYEELEGFARSHGMLHDWQSREVLVDGHIVYVNTMMGKVGRIHKRISVEMTLHADVGILPENTQFEYFERYQSGRFYPSPQEAAREAKLAKMYLCVVVGGGLIGLLALVWHLFLREG